MSSVPVITIDGPSGAGKGTIAQMVASHFDWHLLDSGALYRILGVSANHAGLIPAVDEASFKHDLSVNQQQNITSLATELSIEFVINPRSKEVEPLVNSVNLALQIRTDDAAQFASKVAAIGSVRDALLDLQKNFAKPPGLVADGRDMGTVVFSEAKVKIFLTASAKCRAERRYQQLINKGVGANMRALLQSIEDRDQRDQNRSVSPLVPAADALVIDSSELSIEQVFNQVIDYASEKVV
ncbi:MAG: (d)CMP kinase [Enterobacterales bacterium]|nr:(d)CMP kinase [Enterobacterales bacterium]